jgi:hypothetical protein
MAASAPGGDAGAHLELPEARAPGGGLASDVAVGNVVADAHDHGLDDTENGSYSQVFT